MLLFAGFFLKIGEMSVYLQPLSFISFFRCAQKYIFTLIGKNMQFLYCRYAFEGMIQAIYGLDRPNLYCSEVYCYLYSPSKIISLMDMPTVSFYVSLTILGCWIFCLHIIIYAILCWKIYYARKWRMKLISPNMYLYKVLIERRFVGRLSLYL